MGPSIKMPAADVTVSGGTVTLTTTLGSLSAVTDNNNGTYTAVLTAGTSPGTATISGTLAGTALASTATVTIAGNLAECVRTTDSPAFEPYFVDDDPTNGQGFESAVAYAVGLDGALVRLEVPAGSVAWFGSTLVHRSRPNDSGGDRRTLLYSYQPAGRPRSVDALAKLLRR